jgi:hypothetical protein
MTKDEKNDGGEKKRERQRTNNPQGTTTTNAKDISGNSPTLTHVPPIAEYSGLIPCVNRLSNNATLAPYPADIRDARTPPDPPPMTTRS